MTTHPILYKKTSTGAIQEWVIAVDENRIHTAWGQRDGAKQTSVEVIAEGKNIGKANETTPAEQAALEAASRWEKKAKKGYVTDLDAASDGKVNEIWVTGGVDPMLAHTYEKQGHKIVFPAYVQPKLDGHRCIAVIQNGVPTLWSRTRKPITGVPHIIRELAGMFPGEDLILDGELYNHDYKDRFEELTSFIRQVTPKPGHEVVQYHVYDAVQNGDFASRRETLAVVDVKMGEAVRAVETWPVDSAEDMIEQFGQFVAQGYEGLMVRNAKSEYKNKRSYDLQKVKVFDDAEYTVVAIEEGRGKMAGKAMFVCETDTGETFRVKMMGALDDLKTYFDNPEPWLGRQLTVKFQGLTNGSVPRFPVAVRFREDV